MSWISNFLPFLFTLTDVLISFLVSSTPEILSSVSYILLVMHLKFLISFLGFPSSGLPPFVISLFFFSLHFWVLYYFVQFFHLFVCIFLYFFNGFICFFFKGFYLFARVFLYFLNVVIYILLKGLCHLHEMAF